MARINIYRQKTLLHRALTKLCDGKGKCFHASIYLSAINNNKMAPQWYRIGSFKIQVEKRRS